MAAPIQPSRRTFCKAAFLPLAVNAAAAEAIPVAIQLFGVRDRCEQDLRGVLTALRRFGYQGVEFAGFYGKSATEVRSMLDDTALQVCGSHTPLDQLSTATYDRTVDFNHAIGNRTLIVPGLPDKYHTPDGWKAAADEFNALSNRLASAGMRIGYHNHALEFKPDPDGQRPWDIFFRNTRSEVIMQLDMGNARLAGVEPVELLRQYPGRAKSIHVKDCLPGKPDVMLGSSNFDWPVFLRNCETLGGTEWLIIEHESHDLPAMEAAEQSLRRFQQIRSGAA